MVYRVLSLASMGNPVLKDFLRIIILRIFILVSSGTWKLGNYEGISKKCFLFFSKLAKHDGFSKLAK